MSGEFDNILFEMPKSQSNTIKVIGVGGGGSNAVNHMFQQDIKGVDFVICNTDAQALENSSIPNKIQLGVNLTSGLGAGANPEVVKHPNENGVYYCWYGWWNRNRGSSNYC
jgi:cell division protein FtsZ